MVGVISQDLQLFSGNIIENIALGDPNPDFKRILDICSELEISEFIETLKPMATSNAGSAVMLMPTVKDLIDVNVKNNEQLIKMAGIAQRASTASSNNNVEAFFDPSEIQQLLEEQRAVQIEGQKLLDTTENIQHQIENK